MAFADCRPDRESDAPRPFQAIFIAFSPKAIAELAQSRSLPLIEVRSGGVVDRRDVVAIVPDEVIPTLWVVKAAPFEKPQIEKMAAADHVSFALGGWSHGTTQVFETVTTPDAGRKDVLGHVAQTCF